ncbi:MAG: nucleoside-diphosphate kinase [Candidatus Acidulodesulfobacterium ferriphilum]|uniref:Nucleoside diphosphate kinase n=1 Tax=Candidatus Acidulodesulfobacterium ferriphilum TaxID=2597223 RepID=A0A519BE86_9DELT|nr:MAG: nucleoside-diphosphate kinase [Candidatus Acidulodesulfobacterium ferriphilum]
MERTLSIIKPDGVKNGLTGNIIRLFEENGFEIKAIKKVHLSKSEAEGFYYVHKERPFFNSLVSFMTEGPVVLIVLSAENAILKNRELMGATNPKDAKEGTIRKMYAESIERNVVHGSDSLESAKFEIPYFFNVFEIL